MKSSRKDPLKESDDNIPLDLRSNELRKVQSPGQVFTTAVKGLRIFSLDTL